MKLSIGERAPDFTLIDQNMKQRTLHEFHQKGNVLLAFFPGAFTTVCTHEMCTLRDSISKLGGLSAQVVGISVNDPWTLKGFTEKNGLTFPLLSDYNRSTIASYGVELPNFAGLKGYTVAQRSVFIVDRNGLIKYQWVAPQPGVEPDYQALEEELAVVK